MATRGRLVDVATVRGFVAEDDDEWRGYASFELRDGAMEVSVLQAIVPGTGVGTALLAACVDAARDAGARRVWSITTNDNTRALRFYQSRGFRLAALHRDAATDSRRSLKPEIPLLGRDDIPIRDELELERPSDVWPAFIESHSWPS